MDGRKLRRKLERKETCGRYVDTWIDGGVGGEKRGFHNGAKEEGGVIMVAHYDAVLCKCSKCPPSR